MQNPVEIHHFRGKLVALIVALAVALALAVASPSPASATMNVNPSTLEQQASDLVRYANDIHSGTIATSQDSIKKAHLTIDQLTASAQGASVSAMYEAKQSFTSVVGQNLPLTASAMLKKLAGKVSALAQSYRAGEVGASLIWK